jgi:hypothetical protein
MIYVNYFFFCRALCRLNEIINELGWFAFEHGHIFSYTVYFLLRQAGLAYSSDLAITNRPISVRCKMNFCCTPKNMKDVLPEDGTAVAQWLRFCVTNRKVAGSIPDGVI